MGGQKGKEMLDFNCFSAELIITTVEVNQRNKEDLCFSLHSHVVPLSCLLFVTCANQQIQAAVNKISLAADVMLTGRNGSSR